MKIEDVVHDLAARGFKPKEIQAMTGLFTAQVAWILQGRDNVSPINKRFALTRYLAFTRVARKWAKQAEEVAE